MIPPRDLGGSRVNERDLREDLGLKPEKRILLDDDVRGCKTEIEIAGW